MITIECRNIRDLIVELSAHLSDKLSAVGLIKSESIVLDPLTENALNVNDVIVHVRAFLAGKDLSGDFIVHVEGEKIKLLQISGRKVKVEKTDSGLLICPHCGKISAYEEEMDVHIKAHYFGF